MSAVEEAPAWFRTAVAAPSERGAVDVAGARIVWRAWGKSGDRDLVLVHGGAAHGGWWDHLAPSLAIGCRVVALDLSGHGDSGHRDHYDADTWAAEVEAVVADAGIGPHPILIGHSLGGLISLRIARRGSLPLSGVVVVDSPMSSSVEHSVATERIITRRTRWYDSIEAGVARFRPVPDQPMVDFVADHIARASLREENGQWRWKFDHGLFPTTANEPGSLDGLSCPVVLLAAEHGLLAPEFRVSRTDPENGTAIILLPGAGHAPMLDQPLLLLSALRGVLAGWATASVPASLRR